MNDANEVFVWSGSTTAYTGNPSHQPIINNMDLQVWGFNY